MHIKLSGAGKRFNREWIFRKVSLELHSGHSYAITGPNGSGKSTLLQSIGGMLHLSEGKVDYLLNDQPVAADATHQHVSICAPYLDVIEEMTLLEFFRFHFSFKPFLPGLDVAQAVELIGLKAAQHKQIRYYSSGMKQRVKLAQAIFCNAAIVLLDEPTSNLDKQGIDLYHQLVSQFCTDRLVVVSSNDPVEYSFCQTVLEVAHWKVV
ncbi:ABC transporter ATP-binding protein [Pseudocnuella soli]|uniref:ABC transporter ATP-binding protein n=1 Tax=Pseudocnuella soli TaxID=2502779 RepID=UPI00104285E7|nr:ATP-binding cassette domain-containing protein [Pseudocnuella soli]